MPQDPQFDQDFAKANPKDQHAYLMDTDPDYAKASPQDKTAYLQHVGPQEPAKPGGWQNFKNDISGFLKPTGFNPYPGMGQEEKSAAAGEAYQQDQGRKAAGYSAPYRMTVPFAQSVGVNVPGMEESAKQGDVGGVLGHMAAPLAGLGATVAGAHLLPKIPAGRIASTAGKMIGDLPVGKTLMKAGEFYRSTAPENAGLPGMARELKENSIRERFNKMEAKKNPYETGAPPPVSPTPRPEPLWKTNPLTTTDIPSSYNRQPMANPAAPRPAPGTAGTIASSVAPEPVTPGPNLLPEPRATFPGENPNYMASVPRNDLNRMAINRKPGAGTQLQQLGEPILYIPNEAGYPGPRR